MRYGIQKIENAKLHRVISTGTMSIDLRFYARIELVVVSVEIEWYMRV